MCFHTKGKEKAAEVKSKDVANKLREVEEGEPEEPEESEEPEVEQEEVEQGPEGHCGKKTTAVKTGSDAGGPKGATGTSSTERLKTHHLSSTLQEFVV